MDLTIYAFPRKDDHYLNSGMTLRDYFAAQAMQSMIITDVGQDQEWLAQTSYMMANAMMKYRDADT
jgi:hypothetical protein